MTEKTQDAASPSERRNSIVEYLESVRVCSYQDLAKLMGVSEMTIRRDIDKLAAQHGLIKTLGKVQTAHAPAYLYESAIQLRMPVHRREKEQIAGIAIGQIKPNQTIFLDGGTTCVALARLLARKLQGLTIITYSALVSMEFGRSSDNTVFCLGGHFDPASACFTGPTTEELVRRFFVDIAFLSTKGFLPGDGTYESSQATFRVKQMVAEMAARVVLLVDHSKFGQRSLCKVLDASQIDEVITDTLADSDASAATERDDLSGRVEAGYLPWVTPHAT